MPYSGDPASSPRDETRFLMGDTDNANLRLSDTEVDWLLTKYGTPLRAAIQGVTRLLARYSGRMSKTVGPTSLTYGDLVTQYRGLLADLRRQLGIGAPTSGGDDKPLVMDQKWR